MLPIISTSALSSATDLRDHLASNTNPVEDYFTRNEDQIKKLLQARLQRVGLRYEDELNFHSVQAEVILKVSEIPNPLINDQLIQDTIHDVCAKKGLNPSQRRHESKSISTSNMGSSEENNGHFLLEPEQQKANLHSPIDREKTRKHKNAKKLELNHNGKEVAIPKFIGLTQNKLRWQRLSWQQYLITVSLLNGYSRKEVANLLEVTPRTVTEQAHRARKKLELDLNQFRKIIRENKGKTERKDKLIGKKALYKLLYGAEIDDIYKLDQAYSKVESLLAQLTNQQQFFLGFFMEGYSIPEIVDKTGKSRDSVTGSLRDTKKTLLKLFSALERSDIPEGVDPKPWNNLSQKARELFTRYVYKTESAKSLIDKYGFKSRKDFFTRMRDTRRALGMSMKEMQILIDRNKLLNISKDDLIDRTIKIVYGSIDKIDIPKEQAFQNIVKTLGSLDKRTNLRPFKLFIKGLDHIRAAYHLGQTAGQCKRNIESVVRQVQLTLGVAA